MQHPAEEAFEVVGTYFQAYEAHLAQGQLEAEGIPAWVLDDHPVRMRVGMLGGARVAVRPADAAAARTILAADHSAELDALPESEFSAAFSEQCPRCAQPLAAGARRAAAPGMLERLRGWLGFSGRPRWVTLQCPGCQHVWIADAASGAAARS